MNSSLPTKAEKSHSSKLSYLLSLSEDDFRDQCVRPLLKRMGMSRYRDLCGVDEEGKDAILVGKGPLGEEMVYAVQTKRGKVTMAASANDDLITALRQLRMASETEVELVWSRRRTRPDVVYLIASGEINQKARRYIVENVREAHLRFLDGPELIPLVDEHYPEFWHNIDADRFPYLRSLITDLLSKTDIIYAPGTSAADNGIPITDEIYVPLYLTRIKAEVRTSQGKLEDFPEFSEIESDELLKQREPLTLVLGEGGSGKTTLLRRLAYDAARSALDLQATGLRRLPVMLRAIELAAAAGSLAELLFDKVLAMTSTAECCVIPQDLESGGILVLVDALDEVSTEAGRDKVLKLIREFHAENRKSPVFLSSRPVDSIEGLDLSRDFVTYVVSPISIRQASRMVRRVLNSTSAGVSLEEKERLAAKASEILRQLQDTEGISLSPFLVTVFVAGHDFERRDVPPNMTEIVKKFTELMLGRWDHQRGLAQQFEYPLKDFLVCTVAFEMHSNRQTNIPLQRFSDVLKTELSKIGKSELADKFFEEVVFRSGLFYIEAGHIGFKNLLFQEFFAGRAPESYEVFLDKLADEWWTRAIMFHFGDNPRRHPSVVNLTHELIPEDWLGAFNTAITVGLAAQSAYLIDQAEREPVLRWVVSVLSRSFREMIKALDKHERPLLTFAYYFVRGRQAVATEHITVLESYPTKRSGTSVETKLDETKEMQEFWRLVGLLEAGYLSQASAEIDDFQPDDDRLLLALNLSCALIANLRVFTREDKKLASDIVDRIQPKIPHLLHEIVREVGGVLLELRKGKIVAVDAPGLSGRSIQPGLPSIDSTAIDQQV